MLAGGQGLQIHRPAPVEVGVSNAFENLLEPASVLNDVLQWKWKAAGRDLGRFVVNSTAGVVGLWDVADMVGWKNPAPVKILAKLCVPGECRQAPILLSRFLGPPH